MHFLLARNCSQFQRKNTLFAIKHHANECNITTECKHKQHDLTVFPITLEKSLGTGLDNAQIKECLLDLDFVDVTYNNQTIIVNMQSKKFPDLDNENSPETDDCFGPLILLLLKFVFSLVLEIL